MENNSVKVFENKRWREGDQALVFRHAKALEMVEKGQKVLDVACGDGLLLSALAQKGVSASGVDISEEGVKKCREKGLDALVVDVATENLPFADGTFDTVIVLDVLEHVYAPETLLQETVRVSKKYIIISVPNFNSLPARLQVISGKVPENNRPNKGHVFWFTYDNLTKMTMTGGLEIFELKMNTFFEKMPFVGTLIRALVRIFPSVFALSFIIRARKI